MNIQDRAARDEARERKRAWDLLAEVEGHPKVKAWLEEALSPATSRSEARRRFLRIGAAAAALVLTTVAGTAAYRLYSSGERYQTQIGEQRDVVLLDGSTMTLNTNTAVRVRYSDERRYIVLERGEALFTVKRDVARPFDVVAGDTLTRALGTEFNVDMRSAKVTVSVLEGAVRVAAATAAAGDVTTGLADSGSKMDEAGMRPILALAKGQALEFHRRDRRVLAAQADLKRIEAWRKRRLEFSDTPLAEAVEEFNRYSTIRVTVGTPELSQVRVGGVFRIGDTEAFLYSLREALHVETHESANEIVLVRSAL